MIRLQFIQAGPIRLPAGFGYQSAIAKIFHADLKVLSEPIYAVKYRSPYGF
jgi:hypothetical protein